MAEEKAKSPVVLIAVISVLVVLLAGGVSYFIVTNMLPAKAGMEQKKEIGPLYAFKDEILANLADEGEDHFVKTKITLELSNKKVEKEMDKRTPQIRDTIITILRSKKTSDLQQKDSLSKIKNDIMKKCNDELIDGRVVNVYFTDFVMQ